MRTYVGLICSGADDVEEDVIEEVVLSEERFTRYCTIGSTEEASSTVPLIESEGALSCCCLPFMNTGSTTPTDLQVPFGFHLYAPTVLSFPLKKNEMVCIVWKCTQSHHRGVLLRARARCACCTDLAPLVHQICGVRRLIESPRTEEHKSLTHVQGSMMLKLVLARGVNSAFLLFIITRGTEQLDADTLQQVEKQ